MRKTTLAVLLTSLLLGYGSMALARGPGGGNPGGNAPGKMSEEGRENTNAQWSQGADKGQERAEERKREQNMTREHRDTNTRNAPGGQGKPKSRGLKDKGPR